MRASPSSDAAPAVDCDVIVIGAGPVGLLLGSLLALRGRRVRVLEKRPESWVRSQAIGITPPSLHILAQLGLDEDFIVHGVPIEKVFVHGESGQLGVCDFTLIADPRRFVLAIPQQETMRLLEEKLRSFPNAELDHGMEVQDLEQSDGRVVVRGGSSHGAFSMTASHVVACDGSQGKARELLQIRSRGARYGCHFAMADFVDETALGREAHLFFMADGAVESFPLPDGMRRWIVQTEGRVESPQPAMVAEIVRRRAGVELTQSGPQTAYAFTPRWMNCATYHEGRVLLCGDAAHVMSPIGGQGMNTGFADAEFLAAALTVMQAHPQTTAAWLRAYDRIRSKAALTAMRRAAGGMWLGTWRGRPAARLRDVLMREVMLAPVLSRVVASWFSMVSIPARTLKAIPASKLPHVPHS